MVLGITNVSVTYRSKRGEVQALHNVTLTIHEGEFIVIRGPSGSGKSTLLLSIGGMLHPSQGQITAAGVNIYSMSKRERAKFRAENIGFVFQMFHLVPYLNVFDNILLAANVEANRSKRKEVKDLLQRFNLSDREYHRPSELSAGEKQRTAIARALFNDPKIVLADEPTGNLDPKNSADIIGYLATFHQSGGTVAIVTHGKIAEQYADRLIYLNKGEIENTPDNH